MSKDYLSLWFFVIKSPEAMRLHPSSFAIAILFYSVLAVFDAFLKCLVIQFKHFFFL